MSPTLEVSQSKDEDILYQKDASISAQLSISLDTTISNDNFSSMYQSNESNSVYEYTTQSPNLEQKVPSMSKHEKQQSTQPMESMHFHSQTTTKLSNTTKLRTTTETPACPLECGPGGQCVRDELAPGLLKCLCPLGRGGNLCEKGKRIFFSLGNIVMVTRTLKSKIQFLSFSTNVITRDQKL